jgi:hypothetical protein
VIAAQLARRPADTLDVVRVPLRAGVKELGIRRPKLAAPAAPGQHDSEGGH